MTSEMLLYIKRTHRFPRTWDHFWDYGILIMPVSFLVLGSIILYHSFEGGKVVGATLTISLFLVITGFFFLFRFPRRLNENISFNPITTSFQMETIVELVEAGFRISNIQIDKELGVITVVTKISAFSWGEVITIIVERNQVLVNSHPTGRPISFKDRSNLKKLQRILASVNADQEQGR